PWLKKYTSGVVLVQIRDSLSQKDRMEVADAPSDLWSKATKGFQFFTSPPEGVASARYTSTIFRNDQVVMALSKRLNLRPRDRAFFTTIAFENSADVTYGERDPGTWPGHEKINEESSEVPMDWYLSLAERAGLINAIPELRPESPSRWNDPNRRRIRIQALQKLADLKHGLERDRWLKRLEQAKNYERLVRLKEWWDQPARGPQP